jgi:phosphatidylglycerophosphate synthase
MNDPDTRSLPRAARPWDARLAALLVAPLAHGRITPNMLTSLRLGVGLGSVFAFSRGSYGASNLGAILLVLSNFLDHTDGELARITGQGSRFGHVYDLISDALVTVLVFGAIGVGLGTRIHAIAGMPPAALGTLAGMAIAVIFYLRLRIEELVGKAATRQASVAGFETEDVLYLLPLVTLFGGLQPFLVLAAACAPLFAAWVCVDYVRALRRPTPIEPHST